MIAEGVRPRKGGFDTLKNLPLRDQNDFGTFSVVLSQQGYKGDSAIMWRDTTKDSRGIVARRLSLSVLMKGVTVTAVNRMGESMVMSASIQIDCIQKITL